MTTPDDEGLRLAGERDCVLITGSVVHRKLNKSEVTLRVQGRLETGTARQVDKDGGKQGQDYLRRAAASSTNQVSTARATVSASSGCSRPMR